MQVCGAGPGARRQGRGEGAREFSYEVFRERVRNIVEGLNA